MALFKDVHSIEGSGIDAAEARPGDLARQLIPGVDHLPEALGLGYDEVYSVREHS